jgi:threonine dehydratase
MVAGHVVQTEHKDTLADAVAGGIDDDTITLPLAKAVVDQVIECEEAEIQAALKDLAFEENMLVEGAAALALAGFGKVAQAVAGQTSVIVLCGANYNRSVITKAIYES